MAVAVSSLMTMQYVYVDAKHRIFLPRTDNSSVLIDKAAISRVEKRHYSRAWEHNGQIVHLPLLSYCSLL